ncbi:MAG: hypothetical protein R6W91_08105 [Thermoplasmata archaeon]
MVKKEIMKAEGRKSVWKDKIPAFILILQAIMLVAILINTQFLLSAMEKEPLVDAGNGIILEQTLVAVGSTKYNVKVLLNNTGDAKAHVSVSGEVYISEMGSATGDEATSVLRYQTGTINPGGSWLVDLGPFTAYADWHYFIKVHVSWNGGSAELTEMLVPVA